MAKRNRAIPQFLEWLKEVQGESCPVFVLVMESGHVGWVLKPGFPKELIALAKGTQRVLFFTPPKQPGIPSIEKSQNSANTDLLPQHEFKLNVNVFQACRSILASGCTQVHCTVTVCAANSDEAYNVASLGLVAIMGPDCASWQPGAPRNEGQGACADGLQTFTGNFDIWRAWTAHGRDYEATFAQWGNFIGATCVGGKTVKCDPKSGQFPNPTNGRCQTQQCVLDKSC